MSYYKHEATAMGWCLENNICIYPKPLNNSGTRLRLMLQNEGKVSELKNVIIQEDGVKLKTLLEFSKTEGMKMSQKIYETYLTIYNANKK